MLRVPNRDDPANELAENWRKLRPHLGVGAVFWLRDNLVIPDTGSKKSHPYVIIGGLPPVYDAPRVAMGRFLQLSCRQSYDPVKHGPLPGTEEEEDAIVSRSAVFSRAGEPLGLSAHGVFHLSQFSVQVEGLLRGTFVGWLPRPVIDRLAFRMSRPVTTGAYPPEGAG